MKPTMPPHRTLPYRQTLSTESLENHDQEHDEQGRSELGTKPSDISRPRSCQSPIKPSARNPESRIRQAPEAHPALEGKTADSRAHRRPRHQNPAPISR